MIFKKRKKQIAFTMMLGKSIISASQVYQTQGQLVHGNVTRFTRGSTNNGENTVRKKLLFTFNTIDNEPVFWASHYN